MYKPEGLVNIRRDAKRIGSIYSTRRKRIKSVNKFMLFNFQARWTDIRG